MLVGLLVTLGVTSTLIFTEKMQRNSVASNNGAENGSAALFSIQHDAKSAGLGIWQAGTGNLCPSINLYNNTYTGHGPGGATDFTIAPVLIKSGSTNSHNDANSDSITIAYAASITAVMPTTTNVSQVATTDALNLTLGAGWAVGNVGMISNAGNGSACSLFQVTTVTANGSGAALQFADSSVLNQAAGMPALYPAGSTVQNFGTPIAGGASNGWLTWITYSISNGNLIVTDNTTGTSTVAADNIVFLRAFYGINSGTSAVTSWVPATTGSIWAYPPNATNQKLISAIRVAIIAKNPQYIKPSVNGSNTCDATTTEPAIWPNGPVLDWPNGMPSLENIGENIDLDSDLKWQCYYYTYMSLVIPLKQLIFVAAS